MYYKHIHEGYAIYTISRHITRHDPSYPGYVYVRKLVRESEAQDGKEELWRWIEYGHMWSDNLKPYIPENPTVIARIVQANLCEETSEG